MLSADKETVLSGKVTIYYEDGVRSEEHNLVSGRKEGIFLRYGVDGQLIKKGCYIFGEEFPLAQCQN